jgi:thioredoxin reductase
MLDDNDRVRLKLPAGGVRIHLADGSSLCAARVVLATSSKAAAPLPPCLLNAGGPLASGLDGALAVDVDAQPVTGANVCIIGGGTTAATLALAALSRGAKQV